MIRYFPYQAGHFLIASFITLAMIAFYPGGAMLSLSLLIASVLILGLPHGALDYLWLEQAAGGNRTLLVKYNLIYLACAGAVIALWFVAPAITFVALLAVAWFHFGWGDSEDLPLPEFRLLEGFFRGGVVLLTPILNYHAELAGYFALFTAYDPLIVEMVLVNEIRPFLPAFFAALAFFMGLLALHRPSFHRSLSLGLLALMFYYLPPLAAFAVYFAIWHSWPHLFREGLALATRHGLSPGRIGTGITLITVLTLAIFAPLLLIASPEWTGTLVRMVFLMLLSLTVPHMILHIWLDMRQSRL